MTLTGTYTRNLDEKQRLAVPKRLRKQFSDEVQREIICRAMLLASGVETLAGK